MYFLVNSTVALAPLSEIGINYTHLSTQLIKERCNFGARHSEYAYVIHRMVINSLTDESVLWYMCTYVVYNTYTTYVHFMVGCSAR